MSFLENHPAAKALEADLRSVLEGDVLFDHVSRLLYSTDASIYQIEPIGVVIPKTEEDVYRALETAARHQAPVISRGGGTSLAGQTVGCALQIDFSRHLNRVLEIDEEQRTARVQPGLVLDELNAVLKPCGLMFGPDVATSNRATLGGMIGNNSSGARSLLYGKTVDNVLELKTILSSGETAVFAQADPAARAGDASHEACLYRDLPSLIAEYEREIRARFPQIQRRVGGYNLDELLPGRPFNLAKLMIGSEGTLGTVTEARLSLVPTPGSKALLVVHFHELLAAMEAVPAVLEYSPAAIELLDDMVLGLTRQSLEYSRSLTFMEGDPQALLLVEVYGDTAEEAAARIEFLASALKEQCIGYAHLPCLTPEFQAHVWRVRKAGLGLLLGMKGDAKPATAVEDTAVAPEHLAAYVARFKEIVASHGTTAGFYGHASVGCLHIRPVINLKSPEGVKTLRTLSEEVLELVLEFGGSMSAEHGDGLLRSCWNERFFGPELYRAFRRVKGLFDPQNRLNPGKIVDAPFLTENLRYGPGYRALEIRTHLDFSREGGFDRAVELCNGAGVCRKTLEGTMCPSFMVTRDERHSTRGRANILRAILSGHLPAEEFTGQKLFDALDLCLECKSCKAECPSNVDMAKLKYEFLAHYHKTHGYPLRARLFGNIETLSRLGSATAPLSNWLLQTPLMGWLQARLGIHPGRRLPTFARRTFFKWFVRHPAPIGDPPQVILFHDTFMNHNDPQIGMAATEVLERAGFEVVLVPKKCCGRPMISKGLLDQARANAVYNVRLLAPYVRQGLPIVGCEPSCLLTLRDEYPDLVGGDDAEAVAQNSFLFEEFMLRVLSEKPLAFKSDLIKAIFHGHCHQKALAGTKPSMELLKRAGVEAEELDSGCCGMAGAFGYESEHYEISIALARRKLIPAIRSTPEDTLIISDGTSCRQQIHQLSGRRALHIAEVIQRRLANAQKDKTSP
ncbi:MAG: FAD-binding protein [Armatimonadetes bacterium]|nr:FAD-binding protein [Armatimonadota bacterium]